MNLFRDPDVSDPLVGLTLVVLIVCAVIHTALNVANSVHRWTWVRRLNHPSVR
jgi:hypothetical protein